MSQVSENNAITMSALREAWVGLLRGAPLDPALATDLLELVEDAMAAVDADSVDELTSKVEELKDEHEKVTDGRDERVTELEEDLRLAEEARDALQERVHTIDHLTNKAAREIRRVCEPHLLLPQAEIDALFGKLEQDIDGQALERVDRLKEAREELARVRALYEQADAALKEATARKARRKVKA